MTATVKAALHAFFAAHDQGVAAYESRRFVVRVGPLALPLPNPGWLALHDLHHLGLGASPTFWGEVEVSAFELRTGTPTPFIAFLCVGALVLGALVAPARVLRSYRRYARARSLYGETYDELLGLELPELRRRMGLEGSGTVVQGFASAGVTVATNR